MQTSMMLLSQSYSQLCTFITSLSTPYFRMMCHIWIVTILLLGSSHIVINDTCILTMHHDWHISGGKYLIKSLLAINKHISRRTTHEKLNTRNTSLIKLREKRNIVVGSTKEKGIIDMALLCAQSVFLLKGFQCGGLRHRIRHVKVGRHTACRCSPALCVNIGLGCQTRLPKMYMIINNPREYKTARCIYDLVIRCIGRMVSFYNLRYSGIFHNNGAIK